MLILLVLDSRKAYLWELDNQAVRDKNLTAFLFFASISQV